MAHKRHHINTIVEKVHTLLMDQKDKLENIITDKNSTKVSKSITIELTEDAVKQLQELQELFDVSELSTMIRIVIALDTIAKKNW